MSIEDLKKRAEAGESEAQAKLSLAYFTGDGISKDIKLGGHWFEEASRERDSLDSVFTVKKGLIVRR